MSGKKRKTGNLVALGSAAVVAVYGAGFLRTADAAERFAGQSSERQEAPEASPLLPAEAQQAVTGEQMADVAKATTAGDAVGSGDAASKDAAARAADRTLASASVDANVAKGTAANAAADAALTPAASAVQSTPTRVAPAPIVTAAVAPVSAPMAPAKDTPAVTKPAATPTGAAAAAPPAAPVASTVAATPAAASAPPATAPTQTPPAAAAPALRWKNGEYNGYGSSQHGDIEVYLETTDGKITYIKISQCLTQYSCSWIGDLPAQVLARQSPNVDRVSGATHSANAFYYAVVQALAKAK